MPKDSDQQYGKKEAQRRFEAALKGARNIGPKPMHSMTPKRPEAQRKKTKAATSEGSKRVLY